MLWQFQVGGVNLQIYPLVFPYIFLLFFILAHCHFSMHWYFLIYSYYLTVSNGCSLTALSSVKFTQCSGSFKWGEDISQSRFALVFPYIFLLFFILAHCHFSMHLYFLIYSYYLTVSNGCSLTALSSVKFTQCSGSFKGGRTSAKVGSSAKFELTCRFMLCFTEGLFVLHTKDLISKVQ